MAKKKRKAQALRKSDKQDFPTGVVDPDEIAQFRKCYAQKAFSEARKLNRGTQGIASYYDFTDVDSVRLRRRIAAAVEMAEKAKLRVAPVCPDVPKMFSFEENWMECNASSPPAYDIFEHSYKMSLGAAIWILDRLRDRDLIEDACEFLPTDFDSLNSTCIPILWDPCHNDEILRAMTCVVQQRNIDCEGKKDKADLSGRDVRRICMDLLTTEGKHKQQVDSRRRFEGILDLVPQEEIARAVSVYEETLWDWVERYYRSVAVLVKERKSLCDRLAGMLPSEFIFDNNLIVKESPGEQLGTKRNVLMSPTANVPSVPNYDKLMHSPQISPEIISSVLPPFYSTNSPELSCSQMRSIAPVMPLGVGGFDFTSFLKLGQLLESTNEKLIFLLLDISRFGFLSEQEIADKYGVEIQEIWKDFCIDDPYLICFALFYLLDSGSDLPWLYGPGLGMLSYCAASLPWAGVFFSHLLNHKKENADGDGEHVAGLGTVGDLAGAGRKWFQLDYANRFQQEDCSQQRFHLSHIVYDATGCIMPRNLEQYYPDMGVFEKYGVTEREDVSFLLNYMAMLNAVRNQSMLTVDFYGDEEEIDETDISVGDKPDEEVDIAALKAKIASLQNEVNHFKKLSHDALREARDERERYAQLDKRAAYERRELADLRELVFHQQQGVSEEEATDEKISFPYRTDKRIVVFGGHDSWAREIKPKLPDVRFIDRTMQPNADLIRQADVIWIQTNALSHAFFYKIINEARKYEIPVRYFSFASAVKCAEQIAGQ